MFWSLSFHLLPDEDIIEDSTKRPGSGIRAAYSVFLTNKRAIFRFDGFGSSLTQSFFYHEIVSVRICRRLFVTYLEVGTVRKSSLLNIDNAEYWEGRIQEFMKGLPSEETAQKVASPISPEKKKKELLDMLTALKKNDLITDREFEDKINALDSMKF